VSARLGTSARIVRGLAAVWLLVAIVVVVPVLLVRFVGWPLPDVVPSLASIVEEVRRRGVSEATLVKSLAVIVWLAWARFSVSILVELIAAVRARPARSHRSLGGSQRVAAGLVAAVISLVGAATSVSGAGASPAPSMSATPTAPLVQRLAITRSSGAASAPADGGHWVVQRNDTLWGIAEEALGDGMRWQEIAAANQGREVSPGVRFDATTDTIRPGWDLVLPGGTTAPTGHVVRVEDGDTLASLAEDLYGDPADWQVLWEANQGRLFAGGAFDDPGLILPGWELIAPDDPITLDPASADGPLVHHALAPAPPGDQVAPVVVSSVATDPTAVAPAAVACPSDGGSGAAPVAPSDTPISASVDIGAPPPTASASSNSAQAGSSAGFGLGAATLLGTGAIGVVSSLRRRRLRSAGLQARMPRPSDAAVELELALRAVSDEERVARVDVVIRAAQAHLMATAPRARLVVVIAEPDGAMELHLDAPAPLAPPRFTAVSPAVWRLDSTIAFDELAAGPRFAGFPSPALAQIGRRAGADVYVDLEACGLLSIVSSAEAGADLLRALTESITFSPFGEAVRLVVVGDEHVASPTTGSIEIVDDLDAAIDRAADLVGPVLGVLSAGDSTAALRMRSAGEAWEPVVIAVFGAVPRRLAAELPGLAEPPGRGLAIVTAGSVADARWRLVEGNGRWTLEPLGLEVEPCLVPAAVSDDLAVLVDEARAPLIVLDASPAAGPAGDDDHGAPAFVEPSWTVMVRVLGQLDVVDSVGATASFERSKAVELLAWLTEHRDGATRSRARAALWGQPIQDATFANVVSDARRGLAGLVAPPLGEEWIGRTLSEHLPIHPRLTTDAALLSARRRWAASAPARDAVAVLRPGLELVRDVPLSGSATLWADAEGLVSNLTLLVVSAATDLAERYLDLGDLDGVFWATAKGMIALPGHEELIALRMRAHAQAEDFAGVRTEWESYERVLAADPWGDATPAPKLVELRRRLLAVPSSR
jgi:LysM domain